MSTIASESTSNEGLRQRKKNDDDGVDDDTQSNSCAAGAPPVKTVDGGVIVGGFVVPKELPKLLKEYSKPIFEFLAFSLPYVIACAKYLHGVWIRLPQITMRLTCGFVFCFFGGTFPTLFAAIQAAEQGGRAKVVAAVSDLTEEALFIVEENKKDNELDENRNNIPDVKEISSRELFQRKALLFLRKMHPEKINAAFTSLNAVWFAVAAVLRVQFARTISMSLSISEFVSRPSKRFVEPVLKEATPVEYQKWVPVVMEWIIKGGSMMFAWYITNILIAFTSSLQGGLIISRALYDLLIMKVKKNKALHKNVGGGFGMIYAQIDKLPDSHKQSNLDESMSYVFAILGFYTQFRRSFHIPFPLNLVLWPFQIVEFWIKWTITSRVRV